LLVITMGNGSSLMEILLFEGRGLSCHLELGLSESTAWSGLLGH
jgi:hypothetical protein